VVSVAVGSGHDVCNFLRAFIEFRRAITCVTNRGNVSGIDVAVTEELAVKTLGAVGEPLVFILA
jgi:hypothetical protein